MNRPWGSINGYAHNTYCMAVFEKWKHLPVGGWTVGVDVDVGFETASTAERLK